MKIHIIRSEDYDWIGLYVNDRLVHEGHSIQEEDLVKLLGFEYTHQVWTQEQFDVFGGRCPERRAVAQ
jgi:hypothetical protein